MHDAADSLAKTNSTADPNSYSAQYSNATGANGFDQPFEQAGDVGTGSDSSDLWELYAGSAVNQQQIDLNTFTLYSNGTFTAAVPEPSTWAMMIAGTASLFVIRRRRAQA